MGIKCDRERLNCKVEHPLNPNEKLYFMADPPHLLKNLRAGLCNGNELILPPEVVKENQLPGNRVSIKHVQQLVKFQEGKVFKLAPKLKAADVDPKHFDKMDTGSALHVFDRATADALHDLVFKYKHDPQLLVTSWFIDKVHRWFQLMTSREHSRALSYHNIEKYNQAIQFLKDFIVLIQRIYAGKTNKKGEWQCAWKPWQAGMCLATAAILELQEVFLKGGLPYLLTSRFTQDKLENFFSVVRKKHKTPDALTFKYCIKSITISQYLREVHNSNYQHDDSGMIADFLDSKPKKTDLVSENELTAIQQALEEDDLESAALEQLLPNFCQSKNLPQDEEEVLYYISGYCIGSVQKIHKLECQTCLAAVKTQDPKVRAMDYSFLTNVKDFTGSSLVYCSDELFQKVFKPMELHFRALEEDGTKLRGKGLKQTITEEVMRHTPELLPACHDVKRKLVAKYVQFRLRVHGERESTKIQEDYAKKNRGGERGSKSMMQKKLSKELH